MRNERTVEQQVRLWADELRAIANGGRGVAVGVLVSVLVGVSVSVLVGVSVGTTKAGLRQPSRYNYRKIARRLDNRRSRAAAAAAAAVPSTSTAISWLVSRPRLSAISVGLD
jgi:hypothetical protein